MSHRHPRLRVPRVLRIAASAGLLSLVLVAVGCTSASRPGPPERPGERHPDPHLPIIGSSAAPQTLGAATFEPERGQPASQLPRRFDDLDGKSLAEWLLRLRAGSPT